MEDEQEIPGRNDLPSLLSLLPLGMIDRTASPAAARAAEAVEIVEQLLNESSLGHAIKGRRALLQTFDRLNLENIHPNDGHIDYLRQYVAALCPAWYADCYHSLTDEELEIFIKHYVHAHERWGHPSGINDLVRHMMELAVGRSVPVSGRELEGERREVPEELFSLLGSEKCYSRIGTDFALGRRFTARPLTYEIVVGPVTMLALEKIQQAGWAEGTRATQKLHRLVELTEPFYFQSRVIILLEIAGFVLGQAELGKDMLGENDTGGDEKFGMLLNS
jgi:hypothetical protein